MAPPAAQQQAPPQQAAPAGGAPPDPAAGTDARISAIEQTQRQQGQVLDRVLAAVTGGAAGTPAVPAAAAAAGQPPAANIAEQVRREIADADQRRKAEEDEKTWRAGVTEVVEKVKAEKAPREPETGLRGRLQRLVVGKDPS